MEKFKSLNEICYLLEWIDLEVLWYHCPEGKEILGVCLLKIAWQRMTEKYNV